MSVMIIDYGMGNLRSVKRAFEECGSSVYISDIPQDLRKAERFVLPGVGSFADGMRNLKKNGWIEEINGAIRHNKPMLGICLGMQLLASKGVEGGEAEGLSLISGEVVKMKGSAEERIPHVGWNEIHIREQSPLLRNIPDFSDFYFVHSYSFIPEDKSVVLADTPYVNGVVSIINKGHIYGVQFHPEKSSKMGFCLIRNFLEINTGG